MLSPALYNSYADQAMSSMDPELGICIEGITLNRILYADDTLLNWFSMLDIQIQ